MKISHRFALKISKYLHISEKIRSNVIICFFLIRILSKCFQMYSWIYKIVSVLPQICSNIEFVIIWCLFMDFIIRGTLSQFSTTAQLSILTFSMKFDIYTIYNVYSNYNLELMMIISRFCQWQNNSFFVNMYGMVDRSLIGASIFHNHLTEKYYLHYVQTVSLRLLDQIVLNTRM